jgi:anaerobic magnesium-protoporphyrin IX monomethyl ester cyclase
MKKPRVILINPPLKGEERYGPLAGGGVYMPPLGLGTLAAVLKKNGYQVKILDGEVLRLNYQEAVQQTLAFRPDYVGITAVTMAIHSAAELAEKIKKQRPKLPIILGGVHLSALPEETMKLFPQFDIGVIGEGEVTIIELLKCLRGRKNLKNVCGLIYRQKDNRLKKTLPRPLIEDLDSLPFPAWDLYPDLKKYYRPPVFWFKKLPCLSIVTARGCPSRCTFCSRGVWKEQYREHSAAYVLKMMKKLYYQYGIRDITIYDDTFGINRRRLVELCESLIKEKLDLVWECNFRLEMAKPEILLLMKKAGCWAVAYGIESCSDRVLNFLRKGTNLKMMKEALWWTKQAGLVTKGYIMVGTLPETKKSLETTLKEILKLDLDLLTVNAFTPLPGSLDYERADRYGQFNRDWRLLNQYNPVFIPKGLSQKQIGDYLQLITRRFYLRPRILWRFIKMSFNPRYFKLLFNGAIGFLRFTFLKKNEN